MAITQKPLASGNLFITASNVSIFTTQAGVQIHPFLVLTNASASVVEVSVVYYNGSQELELAKKKIPAGVGKTWRVLEVSDTRLSAGYELKLRIDTGSINYFLSGVEQSDA